MRVPPFLLLCLPLLAACTTASQSLEPIPGSITYRGQPQTKLTQSPVGTRVPHHFVNQWGEDVYETYIIQPDRSLKLVTRQVMTRPF
jgi:hypothetical protein